MDPTTIINTIASVISTAVTLGPEIVKDVEGAIPFAEALYNNLFKGQSISASDLAALEAQVDATAAALMAPLPPDDGSTTT